MKVGEAVVEIVGDRSKLDANLKDAQSRVKSSMQKMQKAMRPVGMAFTAIGVAGLAMIQSTKKINAELGVTALNLGVTTKEMRELTLATTNVTFPIKEVTATFDLLARAGVKDVEVLKATATAFDTLGDATGRSASQVTQMMIPAMKTFGLTATEMANKTDILTYMSRKSTMTMEDFNTMVGYTTPELVKAGLTMEDLTAALIYMERQGYAPGRVMTREFMKATTLATKEQIPLTEALGMTTEELQGLKDELDGATGMTQEYADVANEQYTIMDKLKQKWSELTLMASEYLEPLEPILAGMTALGPLMIGLSMVSIPKLIIAIRAVGHALKTLLLNPIVALIAAIGLLGFGIYSLVKHHTDWNAVVEAAAKVQDELAKSQGKMTEEVLLAQKAYNELRIGYGQLGEEEAEQLQRSQEIIAMWEAGTYVINEATGALELYKEELVDTKEELAATAESTEKLTDKTQELELAVLAINAAAAAAEQRLEALIAPFGYLLATKAEFERLWGPVERYELPHMPFFESPVSRLQGGGIIDKPTLAMLGEQAPGVKEFVFNERQLGMLGGYRTANIYIMLDGRIIGRAVGQPIVDEIRIRTGAKL